MQGLAGQLADMGRHKEAALWFGRHVALRNSLDKENAAQQGIVVRVIVDDNGAQWSPIAP